MKRVIGNIDPSEKAVTIYGAGFSGLVLGFYLKRAGFSVTILEKSKKIGGKIQTQKVSHGIIEKGPNALFLNSDGLELLRDLKLAPLPATKKLRKLLLINGKPRSPFQMGFLSKVLLNARKKPPLVTDGLTVAEFFRPLLGSELIQKFVSPILSGVYATGSENLHFKSIFHQVSHFAQFNSYWDFIKQMKKVQKPKSKTDLSGSVSFEGGMQKLIEALASELGPHIIFNDQTPLKTSGNVIICTEAFSAAELLSQTHPKMSEELRRIKYQEMSSTTVTLKKEIKSLHRAFGVLIPFDSGFHAIGVVNNTAIFPTNYDSHSSFTFIAPKALTPELVREDIARLGGEDFETMEITQWPQGIPLYDLQRFLSVKKLHQLSSQGKTPALFGNYVAGISLREMITAAKDFSEHHQK